MCFFLEGRGEGAQSPFLIELSPLSTSGVGWGDGARDSLLQMLV